MSANTAQTREEKKNVFDERFTNRYAISKTLRFELRPVGKTLEHMRSRFSFDEKMRTFLADQKIEDAYQSLKPLIDSVHEEFITSALESDLAKQIDFSKYLGVYREKGELKDIEKTMRECIGKLFLETGEDWKKEKYPEYTWKKGSNIANGNEILSSQDIFRLLRKRHEGESDIQEAIRCFVKDGKDGQSFFTYFSGFNQNRANYYTIKDEKATAVATRIVHENLPKFCDNVFFFEGKKMEYLKMYDVLESSGKTLVIKTGKDKKEEKSLHPVPEEIFAIAYFARCLSQKEIERYNEEIANANFLVNLYNQKEGTTLKKFKTLYKQIGCGKRGDIFFSLSHEKQSDAQAEREKKPNSKAYSVEEILTETSRSGKLFFQESDDEFAWTIPKLLEHIKKLKREKNFEGVYWLKSAMNTISNRYFSSWHEVLDRIENALTDKNDKAKRKRFESVATFDKKGEEKVKLRDAIELSALFEILDDVTGEDWKIEGVFFKRNLTESLSDPKSDPLESEKRERRRQIIKNAQKPSDALIECLLSDMEEQMRIFFLEEKTVFDMMNRCFSAEEKKEELQKAWKESVKRWLDSTLAIMRMVRYFSVREGKIKGAPMDSELSEALQSLSEPEEADWFGRYDAVRNFLTKKPQDEAMKNKLKLNFENGSLLGGWSDGQEKVKGAVLLRRGREYYLGILNKKSIFKTEEDKKSSVYKNASNECGRLILTNLKFQTLAGKGFGVGDKSYGNIGKKDPLEAIQLLQSIIKDRYVSKYPLFQAVITKDYTDKKIFDDELREILKDCYMCEFTPINWGELEGYVERGDMYLFKIYSKDFSESS